MTVGTRFGLTSGALVAASVLVGGIAIYSLMAVNGKTQAIITDPLPGMARISEAEAGFLELRGNTWRHVASPDRADKAAMDRSIQELRTRVEAALKSYEKTITTAEDRVLFGKIGTAWPEYLAAIQGALELSRQGKGAEAHKAYVEKGTASLTALKNIFRETSDYNRRLGERMARESQEAYARARWILVLALLGCAGFGIVASVLLIRSVNRALRQIGAELGEGADQVASAAGEVSSSSQALAQGSSEQAASLEETSASSEEINSMAAKNSENARTAAQLMTQSQEKFSATNRLLDESVSAMSEISSQSDKISKIIRTIDEIAFQTNILALNAAVEAARAGEAGMGFAVVADEVRNLAQRCAQAAKDTSGLIEESITKSADGKRKVDLVVGAIRSISEESAKVKMLVDEVHLSSQEQARGIDQIGKAIGQMEQVTQKTAASAEESASASEELTAQSEALRELVSRLGEMVGTEAGAARRSTARGHRHAGAGKPGLHRAMPVGAAGAAVAAREPAGARGHEEFPLDEHFKDF